MNKWIAIPIMSVLLVAALVLWLFYENESYELKGAQAKVVSQGANVVALEKELNVSQTTASTLQKTVDLLETDLAAAERKILRMEAEEEYLESNLGVPSITFPDPKLEAAFREYLNKPEGLIYASDLEALTTFEDDPEDPRGISDLTGLEYCVNLVGLNLGLNKITDISVLANLTKLGWIDLWANEITDISPLAGLTNLRSLVLATNNISDLTPLAGLINLETLSMADNNVSDISPLAGLANLRSLSLTRNNITDISPLAGLTGLYDITIGKNNISDISALANLTKLWSLWIGKNNIIDISPLAGLTDLWWIDLSDNNISDIFPLVQNSGLAMSDFVDLRGNPLSSTSVDVYIPQLEERGVTLGGTTPMF